MPMRRPRRPRPATPRNGGSTTEDEVVEDADYEVIDDETATKA